MKSKFQKLECEVVGLFITPHTQDDLNKGSTEIDKLEFLYEGIKGDKHFGLTRTTMGMREAEVYGVDTSEESKIEFFNWRQWTAVSVEEMESLIVKLNLQNTSISAKRFAQLLGANILIRGVENLTKIPCGALIQFNGGVMLKNESENYPCVYPGLEIQKAYPEFKAQFFPRSAMGLRGIVGTVFKTGSISFGESAEILVKK